MPEGLEGLLDLALDLRWSWSHATDELWQRIDPELWDLTHNAWLILQTVPETRLKVLAADSAFRAMVATHVQAHKETLASRTWFQQIHPKPELGSVAYFSMEFGLSEALPIYSGGLGILAGDHLKTASDLGLPVVGVGLLYQRGYFHQALNVHGQQIEFCPYVEAGFDCFSPELLTEYASYYADLLGITVKELLALGRVHPDHDHEAFNMAYLALRSSGAVNGVSRLHGSVSRRIFQPLFPRWPQIEVPVSHVTNGVHMPSWDSAEADRLWTEACGKARWLDTLEGLEIDLRYVARIHRALLPTHGRGLSPACCRPWCIGTRDRELAPRFASTLGPSPLGQDAS